jgi:hypothetical protein
MIERPIIFENGAASRACALVTSEHTFPSTCLHEQIEEYSR